MFLKPFSRKTRRFFYRVAIVLFAVFILSGAFIATLHTPWGKTKLASLIAQGFSQSGWQTEIGQIEGTLPKEISLRNIHLRSPRNDTISIESLDAQISLLRLFKGELAFKHLRANNIHWNLPESSDSLVLSASSKDTSLPLSFALPRFELKQVFLPGSNGLPIDCTGSLKIGRHYRMAYLRMTATRPDISDAAAVISLLMKPDRQLQCTVNTIELPFNALEPWVLLPIQGKSNLYIQAKGSIESFVNHSQDALLTGFIRGSVCIDNLPDVPTLNGATKGLWSLESSIEHRPQSGWLFSKMHAANPNISLQGTVDFLPSWDINSLHLYGRLGSLQQVHLLPLDGVWNVDIASENGSCFSITAASPVICWNQLSATNLALHADLAQKENLWTGSLDAHAILATQLMQAKSHLLYTPNESLHFDDLSLVSEFGAVEGNLELLPTHLIKGSLNASIKNLHEWFSFIPCFSLYGSLETTANFDIFPQTNLQSFTFDAKGSNLFYDSLKIEQASILANLIGSFENLQGTLQATGSHINAGKVFLEALSFDTTFVPINSSFLFHTKGSWKEPFDLNGQGIWNIRDGLFSCSLNELSGSILNRPVSLDSPVSIEIASQNFSIQELNLSIGLGKLRASAYRQQDSGQATLCLERFPIDFLSINPLSLDIAGQVDLSAALCMCDRILEGSMQANLSDLEVIDAAKSDAIHATGQCFASLKNDRLSLNADFEVEKSPLLHLAADLPVAFDSECFRPAFVQNKPISAKLDYQGKIEQILDFFDLGPQRFEGLCDCKLSFENTFENPKLGGTFIIRDGRYENYYCGMQLEHLSIDIEGKNQTVILKSLTAQDSRHKGALSLKGQMNLSLSNRFPFAFDGSFYRLAIADTTLVQAEAEGSLNIKGDIDSMTIRGNAAILESDIGIPDRLTSCLPALQVVYVHACKPELCECPVFQNGYPISFDIDISAPDSIFISGRGLISEWKGAFHLGGTTSALETKGQLELLSGAFHFSGRTFDLTEGTVTLSGQPSAAPQINLAGRMSLQDVLIIARVVGPLDAPEISFHSNPPLPMGSILSYLLFGQELSDINAFQAAQLITSLASLAGDQTDLLEQTRRSLGADRLRIIATPARNSDAEEKLAIQVGKYVTRGVLVSVSQGTEENSTNLSIEVDLTNGFIFQAESLQEEEQGKFTIKWNKNY